MCGILAWVGADMDVGRLRAATDTMVHRGPDSSGYWSDEQAFLGHRRLRIIDLSELGAQPMANEDGQVLVTFNGEIYNYPELRAELTARGHVFRSKSDTEVIVHAYEEYGDACVERLWGMFAFAVWDRRKKRLLAARDRFGKKPLNYVHKGDRLALASEIPGLLLTGLSDRCVDLESLAFFWQLEYIPAPHSAFKDIRKLPAGCAMTFESGTLNIIRYYPPRSVPAFTGSYQQAKDHLGDLLLDATRRRMVADVPLGIALSGGIDSACVVATARRLTQGRLVTVTVRPHTANSPHDEGAFARATAKRYGTEHIEVSPVPDFRESFECIIRNMGEPFAISSAIPCYYLFKMLRQHVTVVVSGDGGDETFAGYDHYRGGATLRLLQKCFPRFLSVPGYHLLNQLYRLAPPARQKIKQAMIGVQMINGVPWTDAPAEYGPLLRPDVFRLWRNPRASLELTAQLGELFDESDRVRLQMLTEQFNRMTYHILSKVDITSMAHAVEARAPLLDHRLAEFARGLPMNFLIRERMGKFILRDLYAQELPKEVFGKPKSGFGLPIRELFAQDLKGYLLEVLNSPHPVYDAIVDRRHITRAVENHAAGRPYQTALLLKLLALRLWVENTGATLPR